jgi:uncharacterized membrane protein YccC
VVTSSKLAHPILADNKAAVFAIHTTASAMLALTIAVAAGLPHPWWAAMTVWLVAQPTRGLFVERCTARSFGTAVGAVVGGTLLLVFVESRGALILALTVWLAACAAVGAVLRHFRSYAAVLAGYTASIVALFAFVEGDTSFHQAVARIACTAIGIGVSAFVSAAFYTREDKADLEHVAAQWAQRCRGWVSQGLQERCAVDAQQELGTLLHAAYTVERSLEDRAAGSLSARRRIRMIRDRLLLDIEMLGVASLEGQLGRYLPCKSGGRERGGGGRTAVTGAVRVEPWPDYHALARAAARPALALSFSSSLWLLTGWRAGPVAVMTATIFASLFASHERANQALRTVLWGTLLGGVAGLGYRELILPLTASYLALVLSLAPFLVAGAFLMARPASAKIAVDMNMSFLLVAQPMFPLHAMPGGGAENAFAMLVGVAGAWLTYAVFMPSNPSVNRRHLMRRILRLTKAMNSALRPDRLRRYRSAIAEALLSLSGTKDPKDGCPWRRCPAWDGQACLPMPNRALTRRPPATNAHPNPEPSSQWQP